MKYDFNEYEPVDARIAKFLKANEDGRIITEIYEHSPDFSTIIFKAYIYRGDILVSTGFATETKGDGYVNKTSHLENCETSAIGRALANYGYHGSKRPSREEMMKAQASQSGTRAARLNGGASVESEYRIPFSKKYKGKLLSEVPSEELAGFLEWVKEQPNKTPQFNMFIEKAEAHLARGE